MSDTRSDEQIRADLAVVAEYDEMWREAATDVRAGRRHRLPSIYSEEHRLRDEARHRLADDVPALRRRLDETERRIEAVTTLLNRWSRGPRRGDMVPADELRAALSDPTEGDTQ